MTRRNSVVVRAGDGSLHPRWLRGSQERNWDLVVSYFGDDPDIFRSDDCIRIDGKGPKMSGLYNLIFGNAELFKQYDYVWLADDDLDIDGDSINRLFEIMREGEFELAQPSLTHDSYYSHPITLHNPLFRYRYTSFLEVMGPCFSQKMLWRLLPTFTANVTGWGVDWLWGEMLPPHEANIGIIDAVQFRHTRPVGGGALYKLLKGKTAAQEQEELFQKFGIQQHRLKVYRGAAPNGRAVDSPLEVLARHTLGPLLPSTTRRPNNWLRSWASSVKHQLLDGLPEPRTQSLEWGAALLSKGDTLMNEGLASRRDMIEENALDA